jgi:hypothetical protein
MRGKRHRDLIRTSLPLVVAFAVAVTAISGTAGCVRSGGTGAGTAPKGPVTVLDVELGPGPERPARTPARAGGVPEGGPSFLAVGADQTIFVYDQARGRILHYREGKYVGATAVPYLSEVAGDQGGALLYDSGRFYLRGRQREFEVDAQGRILRTAALPGGLYPRSRLEAASSGELGADAAGNRYVFSREDWTVVRLDVKGREAARVSLAGVEGGAGGDLVDLYLCPDGTLYTLRWVYGKDGLERSRVDRLFKPIKVKGKKGDGTAGGGGGVAAAVPAALGLSVPDVLRVESPDWPAVEIRDAGAIGNLWHVLSWFSPDPSRSDAGPPYWKLTAAAGAAITVTMDGVERGGKWYTGPVGAAAAVIRDFTHDPARVREVVKQADGATVAILDLPGVERALSAAERDELAAALGGATMAGYYEPPQPLEGPFPRYAIRLKGAGWETAVHPAGRGFVKIGRLGRSGWPAAATMSCSADLAGRLVAWLPVPAAKRGEVAYLYRADTLTISSGGPPADLTRWKATVVRHLLGLLPPGYERPGPSSFTLTFTVQGLPETVTVTAEGFTYGALRVKRQGLRAIAGLQGVP